MVRCMVMELDATDKAILSLAEGDLEISVRPYGIMAQRLGVGEEELIERLRRLRRRGIVREVKAVLRHTRAGVGANAMVVWAVPSGEVDTAGKVMASFESVTHCYEREGFEPYTVFSMIHARTRDDLVKTVHDISRRTGVKEYKVFWSVRELKKTSMRYFKDRGDR